MQQMDLEWEHSCWMVMARVGRASNPGGCTHCLGYLECTVHLGFALLCHILEFPDCSWDLAMFRQSHSCQSCLVQLEVCWTQLDPKLRCGRESETHRRRHG